MSISGNYDCYFEHHSENWIFLVDWESRKPSLSVPKVVPSTIWSEVEVTILMTDTEDGITSKKLCRLIYLQQLIWELLIRTCSALLGQLIDA